MWFLSFCVLNKEGKDFMLYFEPQFEKTCFKAELLVSKQVQYKSGCAAIEDG